MAQADPTKLAGQKIEGSARAAGLLVALARRSPAE